MLRSLNFWLFLVVIICGVSLLLASDISLPTTKKPEEGSLPVVSNWQNDSDSQPVHLRILNGTETGGLAREFRLLVSGKNCVVEAIGNAPGVWQNSLLVNRRLDEAQSKDLARLLGGIDVIRQWDERLTEDVVLILGEDYEKVKAALDQ